MKYGYFDKKSRRPKDRALAHSPFAIRLAALPLDSLMTMAGYKSLIFLPRLFIVLRK